jgi:hypothetical protein
MERMIGVIAVACAATVGLVTSDVRAGLQQGGYENCYLNADSSGQCLGTFVGFRDSSNPNDYVYIGTDLSPSPTGTFNAKFQGVAYSCFVSNSSPLWPYWHASVAATDWFSVHWDSTGHCTELYMSTASYLSETW